MYSDEDSDVESLSLDFSWSATNYEEAAEDYYRRFKTQYKDRFKWIRSDLFNKEALKKDLEEDTKRLLTVIHRVKQWNPLTDRKLSALNSLITKKHKQDKILVFTQFADTARYLHTELEKAGVKNIGLAIGGSDNIVELAERFSPVSNDKTVPQNNELRILISTDVLSEGQNLQDSHIVVNFDLPWAIVRLIQRAGRIDRIGQKSDKIFCYSFLPEKGIERIIGLRGLLTRRISENAEVIGSDEVFFDGDPINLSDLYNESAGVLDDEEDNEVDLASYAYQIWKNAIETQPEVKAKVEELPNVVFGAKAVEGQGNTEGAIIYAKTAADNDSLIWLDADENVVSQSQFKILKAAECTYGTPAMEKTAVHHVLVAKGIKKLEAEESETGGTLGRKNSVKYRTFVRLQRYLEEYNDTLFSTDNLKKALDEIYRYPLREGAIDALSRQMKAGIDDQKLSELVAALHDEGKLCVIGDDDEQNRATQIICSMSLVGGAK
jgi:superfamily II DNA/RNA helicase